MGPEARQLNLSLNASYTAMGVPMAIRPAWLYSGVYHRSPHCSIDIIGSNFT